MQNWLNIYGSDKKLFILIAEDDEGIIGISPLMIQNIKSPIGKLLKVRRLAFIASGISDNLDFIIVKNHQLVLTEFLNFIFTKSDLWDEVVLRDINDHSPNHDYLSEYKSPNGFTKKIMQPYSGYYNKTTGNFTEYYNRLGKEQRRSIRKRIKKIDENYISEIIVSEEITPEFINEIQSLEKSRKRFINRKSASQLFNKVFISFLNTLSESLYQKKWLKVFKYFINEKLAAYIISFSYNKNIYAWLTSYNIDYRKLSAGLIVHKNAIEYAFNNGYEIFDFMRGDEAYKNFFCNERYLYYNYSFGRKNKKMFIINQMNRYRSMAGKLFRNVVKYFS
jgi:hypothetical protein